MSRSKRMPISTLSRAALLLGAGALAGCTSSLPDFSQFKVPTTRSFLPENIDTYVPPASARSGRPVAPDDLVDAQGMCAGMAPQVPAAAPAPETAEPALAAPAPAPAAAAPALGSVGLDMSECELVRAIGPPQSVNVGAGERGERQVTLVYMGNERAGTYVFRNGRLTSLERGPEPPPPPPTAKAKKKKPVAKKKKPATKPPQAPPAPRQPV